jgi:hypothetical protein
MSNFFKKISSFLLNKGYLFDRMARHRAVDILEWETTELENIFALLIFGSFIGLPATPSHITLTLLPYMEKELQLMLEKVDTASGPVSDLFSNLDIG